MKREIIKYLNFKDLKSMRLVSTIFENIVNDNLTRKSYVQIYSYKNLHKLNIINTMGVQNIKFCRLHSDRIIDKDVLFSNISSFDLNRLSIINFHCCNISDTIIRQFLDAFPNLKKLGFSKPKQFNNYEKMLYTTVSRIESLNLTGYYGGRDLTDEDYKNDNYDVIDKDITLRSLKLGFYRLYSFLMRPRVEKFFECIRGYLTSLTLQIEDFNSKQLNWFDKMNFSYLNHLHLEFSPTEYRYAIDLINLITGQRHEPGFNHHSQELNNEFTFTHLKTLVLKLREVHTYFMDYNIEAIDFTRLIQIEVSIFCKNFCKFEIYLLILYIFI